MKPSNYESGEKADTNSDSYSSYESDNSAESRISQTSPPFSKRHSNRDEDSDDDYETTSVSGTSSENSDDKPVKALETSIKSADKTQFEIPTSISKNLPLYYQPKECVDDRFRMAQQQNNSNLLKQLNITSKLTKQAKMFKTELGSSSSDNPETAKKPNPVDSNPSHPTKNEYLEFIPAKSVRNRPKTAGKSSSYANRKPSDIAKPTERPSTSTTKDNTENPVSKLNLQKESKDSEEQNIMSPFRGPLPGEYDPEKFTHLEVSNEIKHMFLNIIRYAPLHINLDYKFKPFIPDYIPSIGDVDAFLKINTPEKLPLPSASKKTEDLPYLGINVLDEPTQKQSDPSLLHLQLRATTSNPKKSNEASMIVKKVQNTQKDAATIDKWIEDVSKLHSTQPSIKFVYSHPMPQLESLMQPWHPIFEKILKKNGFPSPKLNCSLSEYIDLTCTLLDIPVRENKIESLHLLFSLFSATKRAERTHNYETRNIDEITEQDLINLYKNEKTQPKSLPRK